MLEKLLFGFRNDRSKLNLNIVKCLSTKTDVRGTTLAIRREESTVWERRAPLNPNHVHTLVKHGVTVLIQPSTRRAYSLPEYERAGAIITDSIESAQLIIGRCGYIIIIRYVL